MGEAIQEAGVTENLRSVVFKESESLECSCAKIQGYDFNNGISYSQILKSLKSIGFQASNLGDAIETVNQMERGTDKQRKTRKEADHMDRRTRRKLNWLRSQISGILIASLESQVRINQNLKIW